MYTGKINYTMASFILNSLHKGFHHSWHRDFRSDIQKVQRRNTLDNVSFDPIWID
jgi:ectoine hydroxylase-related dioxygenase (phytanoyl-CoA dioxygenase family)